MYCSVENFRNYANAKGFFCYENDDNVVVNNTQPVTTATHKRYVKANGGLNVRNIPNGYRSGVVCTVKKVNGNWGYTASGWIC